MIKKAKGISLIVLVITIIVMIIVAGAIILSLNNGNVIAKAKEAKAKSDTAVLKEKWQTAYSEALISTGGVAPTVSEISDKFTGLPADYEIKVDGIKYNGTDAILIAAATELGVEIKPVGPPIPTGFIASNVTGETTIEEGFVIIDNTGNSQTNGNEFVWIPVPNISEFIRVDDFSASTWTTIALPYKGYETLGDLAPQHYKDMYASVVKYKGFYIGRYEAGVATNMPQSQPTSDTTTTYGGISYKPVSKPNTFVWNYIAWSTSNENETGLTGYAGSVSVSRSINKSNR